MKRLGKSILIALTVVLMSLNLMAAQSVTFLQNGNVITDVIIDMSSRTGQLDYRNGTRVHRSQVWMINFVNGQWNFPNERSRLSRRADTIFLRNGQVLYVNIVDFSSRRMKFEFQDGSSVHQSQIRRIYFCCTQLPAAYMRKKSTQHQYQGNRYSAAFWLNGRVVESPLYYLNMSKTKFMNGLQMNTKDIWMINFENKQWNFAGERYRLDRRMDTVFLKNGQVIYDNIVDFNLDRMTFTFSRTGPIEESRIKRIYFCCTPLPAAYGNQVRGKSIKERLRQKR